MIKYSSNNLEVGDYVVCEEKEVYNLNDVNNLCAGVCFAEIKETIGDDTIGFDEAYEMVCGEWFNFLSEKLNKMDKVIEEWLEIMED